MDRNKFAGMMNAIAICIINVIHHPQETEPFIEMLKDYTARFKFTEKELEQYCNMTINELLEKARTMK